MQPSKTDLSQQFAAFANRPVNAKEVVRKLKFEGLDEMTITEVRLDKKDPAVAELTAAVKKAGLHLRLWTPGAIGTMDYRLDRLNAYIEKAPDNTYRIAKRFYLG